MAEGDTEAVDYSRSANRDKFLYYNTLAGLVKGLEGQYTTVDLRNECCVSGRIIKVDGEMNLEMKDVIFYDSRGSERTFPTFFLKGRNIRYVHIPRETSSLKLIEYQLSQMRATPSSLLKKQRTFKSLRAKRYNKETIQSALVDKSST